MTTKESNNMIKKRATITLVMAKTPNDVIGNNDNPPRFLPWQKLEGDLPRFKKITLGHPIIMGRKTCEIFGKPLPDRTNVVISRDSEWVAPSGFVKFLSLPQAIQRYEVGCEKIFIIGGAQIAEKAIEMGVLDEMILTITHDDYPGDVRFPKYDQSQWEEVARETYPEYGYDVVTLRRKSKATMASE